MSDSTHGDLLAHAIAEVRAAAERNDVAGTVAAQEKIVALLRDAGNDNDAQLALATHLYHLANFYGSTDRVDDAVRALEEAALIAERANHPQLQVITQSLDAARRVAAMSPAERAHWRAEAEQRAEEEFDEEEKDIEAQLAALPPEQRAQMEAAIREFERMTPEQQQQVVAQAHRAQIQSIADQVRDAAVAAQRGQMPREQLLAQLDHLALQIEKEQPRESPWGELAQFIRAAMMFLRGRASVILVPGRETLPPIPPAFAAHFAAIQQSK
ncbi:MAG: hypothetical protein HZC40_08635 [Chloroflexi bacterium]|nr:hypothetical protein [Chloroflexota bacterium]